MVNLFRRHEIIERRAGDMTGVWFALGAAYVYVCADNRQRFNIHALNAIRWIKENERDDDT